MQMFTRFTLIALSLAIAGCGAIAVATAPEKQASTTRSDQANLADKLFWQTLHSGDYDGIAQATNALTAAYLQDPYDATTAAHIGFLHIWRLAESNRLEEVPSTITDHSTLARRYFEEAVALNPDDARLQGFLSSAKLSEANIHQDEKLKRQGYFNLLDSIKAWPEFNLFTAGYTMSRLPASSDNFKKALEWQWQNLEVCVGGSIDRNNPELPRYERVAELDGMKRVCKNSWIAPHNFEGFFLNMGDMMVKSGDWQLAKKIYANAKSSPDFSTWKFADVLQARIEDAELNVARLNAATPMGSRPAEAIMVSSTFACTGCHQK